MPLYSAELVQYNSILFLDRQVTGLFKSLDGARYLLTAMKSVFIGCGMLSQKGIGVSIAEMSAVIPIWTKNRTISVRFF